MVIESMKLETAISAWRDGMVADDSRRRRARPSTNDAALVTSRGRGGRLGDAQDRDPARHPCAEFRANEAHNRGLAAEFRARQHARGRRPQRDLDRLARQGKMFVRERIEMLLDPGTPFLELSTLAANMAYGGEVAGRRQRSSASASSRAAR